MRIPKIIKIGAHNYKIKYPYLFTERGDINGQFDAPLEEIKISDHDGWGNKRTEAATIVTLIHEILHAIDSVTGYGIFKDNEQAIEGFSESILQILVDNGWIKISGWEWELKGADKEEP